MSGHKRVKDIAYDDGDLDDYDEEEYGEESGISESDKGTKKRCYHRPEHIRTRLTRYNEEHLRKSAVLVRNALGPAFTLSDEEIQGTVWYYYFDVDKSVEYLKKKHTPKNTNQTKQPKIASKFDQAVNASAKAAPNGTKDPAPMTSYPFPRPGSAMPPFSVDISDFFSDTPWLNVPMHRRANITVDSRSPRGGLLGGSSKPSKLAALAAARKKKHQEQGETRMAEKNALKESDRAMSLLDRLGGGQKPAPDATLQMSKLHAVAPKAQPKHEQKQYPIRRKRSPSPPPVQAEPRIELMKRPQPDFNAPDLVAAPSTFATTMAGLRSSHVDSSRSPRVASALPLFVHEEEAFAKNNPFLGPSPDDIVTNAQSQSKGNLGKSVNPKSINGVTNGVAKMGFEDPPRPTSPPQAKSKNLDVPNEFLKSNMKRALSFVVIGHVDHGKSTLMGRLLYDLKLVDERSYTKLKKEAADIGKSSFALAWLMDQTTEERERGVTVDIATNSFETDRTRFTILDAPGHRDFIPNMIAGASQADVAVLVIDASTNSFESGLRGQTKEHALLARSIGVQRLIVAVNKMDSAKWSRERYEEISQQMISFLSSAGFQSSKFSFVPCAGLTGDNVTKRSTDEAASWYKGNTLVEELETSDSTVRSLGKPLRMTVGDVFRGGITNPVSVSGRIDSGSLQVGDLVLTMPSTEPATIRGIEINNEGADWAVAGQIVTLHLADIDPIHLRLGDIICHPKSRIKNVTSLTAKVLAFEHVTPMSANVHRGRLNMAAKVTKLVSTLDKSTGLMLKKKPKILQPGSVARVEIEMEKAIPLEVGDRIVLRSEAQTIATGLLERVR